MSTKTAAPVAPPAEFQHIPLAKLKSNPEQPRQTWDASKDAEGRTAIDRLAESIKAEGVLQPLIVTPNGTGYHIVCGERRYRAAKLLKLGSLPCVVRAGLDDIAQLELSITENLQREGLTPIDEAKAIHALIEKCGHTQKQVAKRLGLSVAAVNVKLSLLKLSEDLQKDVAKGELTETQGREVARVAAKALPAEKPKVMAKVREDVQKAKAAKLGGKLSTKDVKSIAKSAATKVTKPQASAPKPPSKDELASAAKYAKLVELVAGKVREAGSAAGHASAGPRFAMVLVESQPESVDAILALADYWKRVAGFVGEAKRQKLVSKVR